MTIATTLSKMFPKVLLLVGLTLMLPTTAMGQDDETSDEDMLRISALQALMDAPADKALPRVQRVLSGNYSDEVKESALFILSQIETSEALAVLLDFARQENGRLRSEAIQVIGIAGHTEGLAELKNFYRGGDENVRQAVLEAYLIADQPNAVYDLALEANSEEELSNIVEVLGAMGAIEQLRRLVGQVDVTEGLINAYAIAGDLESLREIVADESDPEQRIRAIEALGIIGTVEARQTLVTTYRGARDSDVREAAVSGMIIADAEGELLGLYREVDDLRQKSLLLDGLRVMDSDAVLELVDEALGEND